MFISGTIKTKRERDKSCYVDETTKREIDRKYKSIDKNLDK
jgi:hypothetical protein